MTNLGDFMTGADADKMIIQVRQTPQGKINYEKLINVRSTRGAPSDVSGCTLQKIVGGHPGLLQLRRS